VKDVSVAAAPSSLSTEGKFKPSNADGDDLNAAGGRKSLTAQKSPLFETADQLSKASQQLRVYVMAFEAFRGARQNCDVLSEELIDTGYTYTYLDKISTWIRRNSPANLRAASEGEWPPDVNVEVERFVETHTAAREKIQTSMTEFAAGVDNAKLDVLFEELRADSRAMRDVVADGLQTSGQRANHLAEIVQSCVERLRVLLPLESTSAAINTDAPSETSVQPKDPLDDQSTTWQDLTPAGAADDKTLT
jgi:hypothetical protein